MPSRLVMRKIGERVRAAQAPRKRLDRFAEEALEEERGRGAAAGREAGESRNRYLGLLGGFDPRKYAGQTAGALTTSFLEEQERADQASRAYANRTGVLHGASRQAGRIGLREQVGRSLAGLGMQTAGLEAGRIGQFGDVFQTDVGREEAGRNRYLEFMSGERDRLTAEENAKRMAKAQKKPWWQSALEGASKFIPLFA